MGFLRRIMLGAVFLGGILPAVAGDLTAGHSFTPNEKVTADALNSHVNGATINSTFYTGKAAVSSVGASDLVLLYSPSIGFRKTTLNSLLYNNPDLKSALFLTADPASRSNFLAGADTLTISNFLNAADTLARSNFLAGVSSASWASVFSGFWSWGPSITNASGTTVPEQVDLVLSANPSTGVPAKVAFSAFSPAGAVTAFAGSTAPGGWLECDGAPVSRTTYSNLFAVISTTYGAGDGSNTFNLPNLRGEFIRGWDHGRGVDVGRALGSSQTNMIQSHTHDLGETAVGIANLSVGANQSVYTGSGLSSGATGGAETRPRNVALLYVIKF